MLAKPFSWSHSRYKAFESCPRRFYEVDIAKHYTDESDQMRWGTAVHTALEHAVAGKEPLPDSMKDYQKWVDEMEGGEGTLYVEQKYAITRDFAPTEWRAPDVWFRGICDVLRISPSGKTAMARDYKTGAIKHDSRQLMLMAQCIFVHHPRVQRVKTEFVWLKDDCTTPETFDRDAMARQWLPVLPLVNQMEEAHKTLNYPPKPGGLCGRYCPVVSCQFHGKRYRAA